MLLFPPMESVFALTKSAIPTFEGFFFIFTQLPAHVIVETLLYLEIMFILVNGALLWLIFQGAALTNRSGNRRRNARVHAQVIAALHRPAVRSDALLAET